MGEFAKTFRDLDVYQNSLQMVVEIHEFCKTLPSQEKFVLVDQMHRASRSVCSGISEAWRKRRYKAAFISKLNDAESEAAEMQCWLDVALKLSYMSRDIYMDFDNRYEQIISQLVSMIQNADKWCTL